MKFNKYTGIALGIVIIITVFAVVKFTGAGSAGSNNFSDSDGSAGSVIVYKSPSCGCCGNYVRYLENLDYTVDVVSQADLSPIKSRYSIPNNMQSCHTTVIGDYFVEGHVPIEAVQKMLAEQPDVDGIALPAMPAGSPGMPGTQREPFVIYSLTDGVPEEYMVI